MSKPWALYDLLLDRVSAGGGVEEVTIGLTWTLCRAEGIGLAMSPGVLTRTLAWPGTLVGRDVAELATWVRSWDPHQAAVGMAAVNAAINHRSALMGDAAVLEPEGPGNLAVFEWFLPRLRGKRVVVVGRYPGLERYAQQMDLTVLERNPGQGDLPDPACEYLLPEAEWVFLTASAIPNKTFPRLAQLARDANLVLSGPTVPWLPELADFGVDFLAGVQVTAPAVLRQTVAEGGGTRIFEQGVQYRIVDLGLSEMERVKNAIGDTVARRERLKDEMQAWYGGPWRGTFPKAQELVRIDRELSDLDRRYKRFWDARNAWRGGRTRQPLPRTA